jgi:hypothetical protein
VNRTAIFNRRWRRTASYNSRRRLSASGSAAFGCQSREFAKSFRTVPAPRGYFRRVRKSLNLLL